MKNYKKIYNKGNKYFDTYYIYDKDNNKYIGILEIHCRGVKQTYYVGWHFKNYFYPNYQEGAETQNFNTEEEAMIYITDNYTK